MRFLARRAAVVAATTILAAAGGITAATPASAAELAFPSWRITPQPDLRVLGSFDINCYPGYDGSFGLDLDGEFFLNQNFRCPSSGSITLSGSGTRGVIVDGVAYGELNPRSVVRMRYVLQQFYTFSTGRVAGEVIGPQHWPPSG